MIVNVCVPVTCEPESFLRFIQRESSAGVRFYVGIKEKFTETFKNSLSSLKNAEIHVFSNHTGREEMLNSLHKCKKKRGKILIARRPLNEYEFSALKNSQTDITSVKAEHNLVYNFFKNLASKMIKKIFAFSFFEDISAICFGEDVFDLLCALQNLSTASRLNRYVGLSISYVTTRERAVSKEFDKAKTWSLFVLLNLFLVGSFVGGISILALLQVPVMVFMLVILWMIVALLLWVVELIAFVRSLVVGNLKIGEGEEFSVLKPKQSSRKSKNLDEG